MSRPRFALVLIALATLAIAVSACGDGGGNDDASPQEVAEKATLKGIESGRLDLSLEVDAAGKEGGDLSLTLSGPFQQAEEGGKPQFDLDAEVKGTVRGDDVDFQGGLVLLPNTAYVNYEGTEYEVDPTTLSFVESTLNQAQSEGGQGAQGATACQRAAAETDIASFVDGLKNEGSADVGGTETTKLSGELNVTGAVDALRRIVEHPACRGQLQAAGDEVPSGGELAAAEKELQRSLKEARMELYVGDDDIVRRIVARVVLQPKAARGGPSSVEIDFDLTLEGVNESQEIPVPDSTEPLSDLFLKLGVNPLELAGALQGGEGLGALLDELGEAAESGSAKGGGKQGGDGGRGAYLDCIGDASSAADLQRCNKLLQ